MPNSLVAALASNSMSRKSVVAMVDPADQRCRMLLLQLQE